jgi:phenylacetate-coenzyme A ligase PaaK-like adenylate-forming protein
MKEDPSYKPVTVLLDEVKPNQNYELVITNLLGGALVRYRIGDIVRIISLREDKLGIDLPQMVFHSRVDNIIDIAGFTRLTEKTIWQAIENSGVDYKDWTACKEGKEHPILHVYLELNNTAQDVQDIAKNIHQRLTELDTDYANLEALLNMNPLQVTILPHGAFQSYAAKQQSMGTSVGKLKPPHVNPTEQVLNYLTNKPEPAVVGVERQDRYEKVAK